MVGQVRSWHDEPHSQENLSPGAGPLVCWAMRQNPGWVLRLLLAGAEPDARVADCGSRGPGTSVSLLIGGALV